MFGGSVIRPAAARPVEIGDDRADLRRHAAFGEVAFGEVGLRLRAGQPLQPALLGAAEVDRHPGDAGRDHEQVGVQLARQHARGEILVDHRLDAVQVAVVRPRPPGCRRRRRRSPRSRPRPGARSRRSRRCPAAGARARRAASRGRRPRARSSRARRRGAWRSPRPSASRSAWSDGRTPGRRDRPAPGSPRRSRCARSPRRRNSLRSARWNM